MFGNFGKLFFTNAVLAGVASSCVCAGEETKNIEDEIQREKFIPKDISLIKELDQENLNKEENKDEIEKRTIYAAKVLTAVGFISVFLLFLGQRYLKYKALKKVDDSWKDLDGGAFVGSFINKIYEKSLKYKELKSDEEKIKYLLNLKNSSSGYYKGLVICQLEDIYKAVMKEKSFRNIFWNLKSAAEIKKSAEKDGDLKQNLENLKQWGNILNGVKKLEPKKLTMKKREDPLLEKLNKLEGAEVFLELMGINEL